MSMTPLPMLTQVCHTDTQRRIPQNTLLIYPQTHTSSQMTHSFCHHPTESPLLEFLHKPFHPTPPVPA